MCIRDSSVVSAEFPWAYGFSYQPQAECGFENAGIMYLAQLSPTYATKIETHVCTHSHMHTYSSVRLFVLLEISLTHELLVLLLLSQLRRIGSGDTIGECRVCTHSCIYYAAWDKSIALNIMQ